MKVEITKKEGGFVIRSEGFHVEIHPDKSGGVIVCFFGKPPRKLKYVVEKNKNLFVNLDIAKILICNEISRL